MCIVQIPFAAAVQLQGLTLNMYMYKHIYDLNI